MFFIMLMVADNMKVSGRVEAGMAMVLSIMLTVQNNFKVIGRTA